jgi:hypothetical protein
MIKLGRQKSTPDEILDTIALVNHKSRHDEVFCVCEIESHSQFICPAELQESNCNDTTCLFPGFSIINKCKLLIRESHPLDANRSHLRA